ncbi:MAG: bifunctional DNA primase/polymerase [Pseudomonadota bacterium]
MINDNITSNSLAGQEQKTSKGPILVDNTGKPPYAFACFYAKGGLRVHPCHAPLQDGTCSCGEDCGNNRGKHPRLNAWQKLASNDEAQIREWWSQYRDANVGALIGESGYVVIDLDGETGLESWKKVKDERDTGKPWIARTGGGGWHLFYRLPEGHSGFQNSTSKLGERIDVKCNGGYVILPPSRHKSGNEYQWVAGASPFEGEPDAIPDWLAEVLKTAEAQSKVVSLTKAENNPVPFDGLPDGMRNEGMFAYAEKNKNLGMSKRQNLVLCLDANSRSKPPKSDKEIETILDSVYRYPLRKPQLTEEQIKILREAVPRIEKKDRSVFQDGEVVVALAAAKKYDPGLYGEIKDKTPSGMKRDLERVAKDHLRLVAKDEQASRRTTIGEVFSPFNIPCPEEYANLNIPFGYFMTPGGVKEFKNRGTEVDAVEILHEACFPAKRFISTQGGSEEVELARFSGNGWKTFTIPREICVDRSKVVGGTARYGYPSGSGNAAAAAQWHLEVLLENQYDMLTYRVAHRFGWLDDETGFMLGDSLIHQDGTEPDVIFRSEGGDTQTSRAYREVGSWDRWKEIVAPAMDFSIPRAALYASFAAPLVRIFGTTNFFLDISGLTSRGKTTCLRLAASVWGNPGGSPGGMGSVLGTWDTTRVAAERKAALVCDTPLILDDTKRAARRGRFGNSVISEILYSFDQGQGRDRGSLDGRRQTAFWQGVLLSSGEAKVTSYSEDAGQRMRGLCIEGLPFGETSPETTKLVNSLNAELIVNYGHAGRRFVLWLIENRKRWKEFRDLYNARVQEFSSQNELEGRWAGYAAAISIAGQLVHEALGLPWDYKDPFIDLWEEIKEQTEDVDIDRRALVELVSWAAANPMRVYSHSETPPAPKAPPQKDKEGLEKAEEHKPCPYCGTSKEEDKGKKGFDKDDIDRTVDILNSPYGWAAVEGKTSEGVEFLGFTGPALRELLPKWGFDTGAVLAGWKAKRWLITGNSGTQRTVKVQGKPMKVYAISNSEIEKIMAL